MKTGVFSVRQESLHYQWNHFCIVQKTLCQCLCMESSLGAVQRSSRNLLRNFTGCFLLSRCRGKKKKRWGGGGEGVAAGVSFNLWLEIEVQHDSFWNWLPVKSCCEYKIATFDFRHFDGTLPPYRSASLCTYQTSRTLWSSSEKLLKIPKNNLKSVGERSFSFIASSVRYSLPCQFAGSPFPPSQYKAHAKLSFFKGLPTDLDGLCFLVKRLCVCMCVYLRECVCKRTEFTGKKKSHALSLFVIKEANWARARRICATKAAG